MAADHYKTLDVSRSATTEEIRKSYKKLSAKYHPDRNPDDEKALAKYKQIQEAWSVLKDPEKRKKYDMYGDNYNRVPGGGGSGVPPWAQQGGGQVDLNDLFGEGGIDLGDIFGGGFGGGRGRSRRPQPRKGEDLKIEVEVPFYVGVEGGQHDVRLNRNGKTETIEVKVPPGVDNGSVIRLAGLGNPGSHGGPAGDLRLTVRLAPHPWLTRDGKNLLIELPVTPPEAALGARVDVPTLADGTVVLTIPPGTSSGQKLRIRGKGIPDRKSDSRGDLLVKVMITMPKELSDEAKSLYEQLRDTETENPREHLG